MLRERWRLYRELADLGCVIRGSIFERFSTCSRPHCSCHAGRRHGPRVYVAVTQRKRQRQFYVPKREVEAVRAGVRQYHRFLEILDQLTTIHLKLMRKGVLHDDATR